VLALRVLKEGAVSSTVQLVTQVGGYRDPAPWLPPIGGDWGFVGSTYVLYEEELDTLSRLYRGLDALQSTVVPAVHRFDLGCRRPERRDRFIDWWVALESLFGDKRGELTYKLSLRIAYFTEDGPKRPDLARKLRRAYDARSDVVHGQEPKEIKTHEQVTCEALRSALQRLILAQSAIDLQKLDDFIAAGAKMRYDWDVAGEARDGV
jgi:hypothetical protein